MAGQYIESVKRRWVASFVLSTNDLFNKHYGINGQTAPRKDKPRNETMNAAYKHTHKGQAKTFVTNFWATELSSQPAAAAAVATTTTNAT